MAVKFSLSDITARAAAAAGDGRSDHGAAMAGASAQTAKIVAGIGGLPELVTENVSGWTFESGSAEALEGALRRVAELPDAEVAAAGPAARRRIEDEFSPRRYLERIRTIYGRLGVEWP